MISADKPAAAISAVIDDDDLLGEILLCLGRSTYLVRAAAVCKRWLRLASEPAFLRRFRERNPPCLLGFYVRDNNSRTRRTEFVPVSADPLFAKAAAAELAGRRQLFDCRNGRLLVRMEYYDGLAVCYPMCPARVMDRLPPPPTLGAAPTVLFLKTFILPWDGGKEVVHVAFERPAVEMLSVQACVLRSGAWGEAILATAELPEPYPIVTGMTHVHGKLYMSMNIGCILRLDLAMECLSTMNLPSEVGTKFRLAYKEDSGLLLVHVKGFELSVWRNESDGDGADDWVLVDTFRVLAGCDRLEEVLVLAVGDDAEFVLLGLRTTLVCVDLRRREEAVYQTKIHALGTSVFPFTTVWPPVFPALDGEQSYLSR